METTKELALTRRISWGSIIGGVITVLAISLLLSMLGTSLGLSMIQPQSDDISNGAGTTVLIGCVPLDLRRSGQLCG
jgi:ABC-type transport system involved in multi-copper enzyme maturation permease subunit